ncbi:cell division protein Fic [Serratia marcescens]|nr:cell division protein Fic [Serratia marcescens]
MDKYDASNDHYCYRDTVTLKNKLDIRDMEELEKAERDITVITAQRIVFSRPPYDLEYMQNLHFQLFSELYEWAGELRSVDISKGDTRFCNTGRIIAEANKLLTKLENDNWLSNISKDEFCDKAAEYYCEFNMIHPFREGNGRVQRVLFDHLSLAAGYDLDWGDIDQNEWIQANIEGFYVNYGPMSEIFRRIVTICA